MKCFTIFLAERVDSKGHFVRRRLYLATSHRKKRFDLRKTEQLLQTVAEDYDKVIEEVGKAMELDPSTQRPRGARAFANLMKGLHEEAISDAEAAYRETGGNTAAGELAYFQAKTGHIGDAKKMLADLKTKLEKGDPTEFPIAVAALGLGMNDESLRWFEKAFEAHSTNLLHLKADPMFREIWSEPRIQHLWKKKVEPILGQ